MSDVIEIIPKTLFSFEGRQNSTQDVVLAERVPSVPYASGTFEVMVFSLTGVSSSAVAQVTVSNESEEPEDPGAFFTGSSAIATVSINSSTQPPVLLAAQLTGPIGSMLRVRLRWLQGSSEAAEPQKLTIAANLVMRMGA
jgi:hypothetical protein